MPWIGKKPDPAIKIDAGKLYQHMGTMPEGSIDYLGREGGTPNGNKTTEPNGYPPEISFSLVGQNSTSFANHAPKMADAMRISQVD